jgi:outer membrane protein assembly factor BamB
MSHLTFSRSLAAALAVASIAPSAQAADWLQFGFDQAHSGANPQEKGYSVAGVNTPRWSVTIQPPGATATTPSDTTPVFLSGVATASGTKDLIFLITTAGHIVAFDAANGSVVWSHQPMLPLTTKHITTGSAAIDPSGQFVYAYALDGFVHKYQVGDGTEITTGGWPQLSTSKTAVEKGAAALAIASPPGGVNYLYHVINGYVGDNGDYQGHITSVNLSDGSQKVFNAMCSNLFSHFVNMGMPRVDDCDLEGTASNMADGQMSGIWGRPGTIYDAQTNRIFVATGNGLFDANLAGDFEWGDTVLALNPDGSGSGMGMPVDSFTPSSFATLYANDTDLGSTSPALLPSTSAAFPHLAVQSGKDACVRLLNIDDLSGAHGPGNTGGELNAATSCDTTTDAIGGGVVFPQPAVWVNPADNTTWFYVINNTFVVGYRLDVSGAVPAIHKAWTLSGTGVPGTSPVIANGTLYYATLGNTPKLRGLDLLTGAEVWSATIGKIKWQSPIVVNGHLYITDNNATLWSFALEGVFKSSFD